MTVLWICEKPSQASDIAKVLGINQRNDGFINTKKGDITWAFGHLLEQAPPEDYDDKYKKWRMEDLPITPSSWQVKPTDSGKKQLQVIGRLLKKASSIVVATDADREGEAIGREILDYFHYQGTIQRLWLSALDATSVQRAVQKLMPGEQTACLYEAAKARSRADWLYGMNLTRAASISFQSGSVLSVGRVQTPTLGMVVQRDLSIEAFSSRQFYELIATAKDPQGVAIQLRHKRAATPEDLRIYNKDDAEKLAHSCVDQTIPCTVKTEKKKESPPKLFSLSGLQKECNKLWGWSAEHTLNIAQKLYETHKVTSYPRTDCNFIPEEQTDDIPDILHHLKTHKTLGKHIPSEPCIRTSVFNTKKITAHHAIIPTTKSAQHVCLSDDEDKAYSLICQHFLMNLWTDYLYHQTQISVSVHHHLFRTQGKTTIEQGWKCLQNTNTKDDVLPPIQHGEMLNLTDVHIDTKKTTPPQYYTEGTLIGDMATVAKFVNDPKLKSKLKETSGIGTEATRASIIEVLKRRKYIKVKGKQLVSTGSGRALIQALPDAIANPGSTAIWEDLLEQVSVGELSADVFVRNISEEVSKHLQHIAQTQGVQIGKPRQNPPTPKMLALAKKIAKSKKKSLPKEAAASFDVCKQFLEQHIQPQASGSAASPKQIAFAEKLAKKHNKPLPDAYQNDRQICSKFIDTLLKS